MDKEIDHIQALDRDALLREILHFEGRVRLDFSEAYLATLSTEQLRHLLLAAVLQSQRRATAS